MDISDDILHIFHEDFFEYPTTGIYMQTKCWAKRFHFIILEKNLTQSHHSKLSTCPAQPSSNTFSDFTWEGFRVADKKSVSWILSSCEMGSRSVSPSPEVPASQKMGRWNNKKQAAVFS